MNTELTLKLDKQVIEKAKEYAVSHKRSLSGLIETYLKSLDDKEPMDEDNDIQLSPFVKSMRTGINISADLDYKNAYGDYLSSKYL